MKDRAVLKALSVWKSYGGVLVLRDISLSVGEGEIVEVKGRSGVGKTTLLRILGLLEEPDRGDVCVLGRRASSMSMEERAEMRLRHIGVDLQPVTLIPTLTVLENIELPMALAGIGRGERRRRALELLEYFNLGSLASRKPETLSMGERRRISIIRALANNPEILLVDEPTANLDEDNAALVVELLREACRDREISVVATTVEELGIPGSITYRLEKGALIPVNH